MKQKRWIRGTRTDMVKENGKSYYRICRCGAVKESYKMSLCRTCNRNYLKERNKNKTIVIKDLVVKGKNKDNSIVTYRNFWKNKLINFVNTVERRRGWVTMEELFVDMITLFNYYGCNQDIDVLPTGSQLSMMWNFLKDYKNKIEKSKKIKKTTFQS